MGLFTSKCFADGLEGEEVFMKILVDEANPDHDVTVMSADPAKTVCINGKYWNQYDSATILVKGATVWTRCPSYRF